MFTILLCSFYDRDVKYLTNNDLQSVSWAAEDYYGLAEVVSAQWDKECANLTLYNRDVVYDQDFFVKNTLTIAPQQTTDLFYTPVPFAEPQTFTDGGSQDRFVIEPGVNVNMVAGEKIILKRKCRKRVFQIIQTKISLAQTHLLAFLL